MDASPNLRMRAVAAVALASVLALASSRTASGSGASDGEPFEHARHVPKAWARGVPEVSRDCRGCHDYESAAVPRPQTVCTNCHVRADGNESAFELVSRDRSKPATSTASASAGTQLFAHQDHLGLACRQCHGPKGTLVVDPMPVTEGFAQCLGCHGSDVRVGKLDLDVLADGTDRSSYTPGDMLGRLNRDPRMGPAELGPFLHSEHLADAQAADESSCATCHHPVVEASSLDAPRASFSSESCGRCHLSETGPLRFATAPRDVEGGAAGTFSHQAHLSFDPATTDPRKSSVAGYQEIERESCRTCHSYDAERQTFSKDRAQHENCVDCHDHRQWRPKRHGGWASQGCTHCHTFAGDRLGDDRPTAEVRRQRLTTFLVETQRHPFISDADADRKLDESSCKECHVGAVGELPSRVQERSFSHATHLPPDPTIDNCLLCHQRKVERAATSAALGNLTFDLDTCTTCHLGSPPQPRDDANALASRTVIEFNHAAHLGRSLDGRDNMTCLTCHPAAAPEQRKSMGSAADVLSCTACHDHSPSGDNWRRTGGVSADEVQSCGRCHTQRLPGIGRQLPVRRLRVSGLVGANGQFHPSDRGCDDCHVTARAEGPRVDADRVFAKIGYYELRTGQRKPDTHRYRPELGRHAIRDATGTQCFDCHWKAYAGANVNPEDEFSRGEYGNLMARYPGGDFAGE